MPARASIEQKLEQVRENGGAGGGGTVDQGAAGAAEWSIKDATVRTALGAPADAQADESSSGSVEARLRYISARLTAIIADLSPIYVDGVQNDVGGVKGANPVWTDTSTTPDTQRVVSSSNPLPIQPYNVSGAAGVDGNPTYVRQAALTPGTDMIGASCTPKTTNVTGSGDATLVTPAAGKKLRVHYLATALIGSTANTVSFKIGASAITYTHRLQAQGAVFAHNLRPHYWEGAVDEVLKINLSAGDATGVAVTVETSEV